VLIRASRKEAEIAGGVVSRGVEKVESVIPGIEDWFI
jgi:hypothetical protein